MMDPVKIVLDFASPLASGDVVAYLRQTASLVSDLLDLGFDVTATGSVQIDAVPDVGMQAPEVPPPG